MALFSNLLIRLGQFRPVLIVLVGLLSCCPMLLADTTWVAGQVYGVWDTLGSPYMVTDTITVPLDSTLEIRQGVEIWFLDQEIRRTPILVHGRFRAIGEQGDSIYFYSPVTGFAGIKNNSSHGSEIRLEYCVIDSLCDAVSSRFGSMTIKRCRIRGYRPLGYTLIQGYSEVDTVQYCALQGEEVYFELGGPSVFQHNRGARLFVHLQQMEPIFGNNLIAIHVYYESAIDIYDNHLEYAHSFHDNSYWHNNRIEGCFNIWGQSPIIENNIIGYLDLSENYAVVRGNEIGQVEIDDCELVLQKNLVVSGTYGIKIFGGNIVSGSCTIRGNTIIFGTNGIYAYGNSNPTYIFDNIFVGDAVNCTGVSSPFTHPMVISYNDFYNVTAATHNCELDTGNIFLDPCFRSGYPYDYRLQANSPCIDAGDPASPLDPDSTRADMGAYYYDQLHDQPPALISPPVVNVQDGTTLRYVARATDDFGPLRFGFWDMPGWLHIVHGGGTDWVADSAVVQGRVPYDQEDFTFGVWVEDGLAQRDSQEVSVLVSPYTILAGEVTGVLTRDQSPYMVVEDVVVPVGDSLRIEPGVEVRFQWHPVEDLRHRIVVRGTLHAVGTPEDTIYFLPEFGDSLLNAWRGIWCVGDSQDTSRIGCASFHNGAYAIVVDSQATMTLERSRVRDTRYGISVTNQSWAGVDSSDFHMSISQTNRFVFVDSAEATVTNSYFENPLATEHGTHIFFWHGSRGTVRGCVIVGGLGCKFDESCYVDFIRNNIMHTDQGVRLSNHSSGIAANNIFSDRHGLQLALMNSMLISNNVFHNTIYGIRMQTNDPGISIKNNILLENQIGIEMSDYYPAFTYISYNDFYGNDSDFVNCIPDSTNIYLDPIIHDTIDFRLSTGSPCIDAGDPDPFFNDVDSTRNDIGCWGGPWGESYPYVHVLSQQPKPIPIEFALLPPYPNPFNSILVIPFTIPDETAATITIYNVLGQEVHQFKLRPLSPGAHRAVWNSASCASGIYILQLTANGKKFAQKVLLLR
jgi:hypothetical protein